MKNISTSFKLLAVGASLSFSCLAHAFVDTNFVVNDYEMPKDKEAIEQRLESIFSETKKCAGRSQLYALSVLRYAIERLHVEDDLGPNDLSYDTEISLTSKDGEKKIKVVCRDLSP